MAAVATTYRQVETTFDSDNDSDTSITYTNEDIVNLLKDLKLTFQKDLKRAVKDLTTQINDIGTRTNELEKKTDSIITTINKDRSKNQILERKITELELRLEEQENRQRRGNLRFRAVPESITDLHQFAVSIFRKILPEENEASFRIDRIHRALGRPKNPEHSRDIIMKMHYSDVRDKVLFAMKNLDPQTKKEFNFAIYPDLAKSYLIKKAALKPVAQFLQKHNILYKWGHPFMLSFKLNGKVHKILTPEEGLQFTSNFTESIDMDTSQSNKRPQRDWTSPPTKAPKKVKEIAESPQTSGT